MAAFAQQADEKKKNMVDVSLDRLATYIYPSWFEEEMVYPADSSSHRRAKLSYFRTITNAVQLRVGYEFYNNYGKGSNGKNIESFSQSHTRFQVLQIGANLTFAEDKRLRPLLDIGYEMGQYTTLHDWWERYDHNRYGPGTYSSRYHEETYHYNVFGVTANVGLFYKINSSIYISSSIGGRFWLGLPKNHDVALKYTPHLTQSNVFQLGFMF